jgi:hypothetical protein
MMRRRGVRVVLLVEDRSLERFAREVLLQLGFHRCEVRVIEYPAGRGSAKQWVEKRYPTEVKAYRREANHQQVALLVGTEADEKTVADRFRLLASKLTDAGHAERNDTERIALWVPKWNVETWILHLSGEDVGEEKNYKHKVRRPDYRTVAEAFVKSFRESPDERPATLPSLEVAFKETHRLDL